MTTKGDASDDARASLNPGQPTAMRELERFETAAGDFITLSTDGARWEVACWGPDQKNVWTETAVAGPSPFTEREARAEFERWRGE